MSSGFVSERTSGKEENAPSADDDIPTNNVVDSWAAADVAAAAISQLTNDGRSLFEVLQANKARKQEEVEEKLKFKNQFRALDDDEVDFLDTIVSAERAKEAARKKEIESQLDEFRKQQYEADHDGTTVSDPSLEEVNSTWAVNGRKRRKKEKEGTASGGTGLKLRKMSDGGRKSQGGEDESKAVAAKIKEVADVPSQNLSATSPKVSEILGNTLPILVGKATLPSKTSSSSSTTTTAPTTNKSSGLGSLIADYGSDSDE